MTGCKTALNRKGTRNMLGYLFLGGAILGEVFATTMMKISHGFTVLWPTIGCIVGYIVCFFLLSKALVTVNLSVGYAVWAAVGIVLTSIIAVIAFGEHLTWPAILGMVLIIVGVVLVNLFGAAH